MTRIDPLPLIVSLLVASGLMGWVVWSQRPVEPEIAAEVAAPPPAAETPSPPAVPPVDETRAADLRQAAEQAPADVQVRIDLGNLYFYAQRFEEAVPWYEGVLALETEAVDVSTDLALAYYYLEDTDRALAQFDRSLEIDPAHPKTFLSIGMVRAFGNRDLDGAMAAWEEVVRVAPGTSEALAATEALESLRAVH
ncbi:MAG: tetratricopeptide repeat protein [Vicinamibacterales bacterium]|nr:tetratricopeptide repeat protein [Vicinamibacterales bacterium]